MQNRSLLAEGERSLIENGRTMDKRIFTDCSPIFIAGSVRSGTTLLQLLLNAHPNIAIFGELHYFDQILQLKHSVSPLTSDEGFDSFLSLVKNVDNYQYIPDAENFFTVIKEKFKNSETRTSEAFFRCVLEEYAESQGAKRFGEKTPTNIRYLEQLVHIFPHAKIIHIIRDPRDVVASSITMPWTANDAVINAYKWKCDIIYSQTFLNRTESYMELRYEDLVHETEDQLKRICSFIGEDYDSRMLEFYKTSQTYVKNEPWKETTQSPINRSAIKRWSRDLSAPQVFLVEKIVGSFMERFRYERAEVHFTAKLLSPAVFVMELLKYARYKCADRKMRRTDHPDVIFGEKNRLYKMFFKSIFK